MTEEWRDHHDYRTHGGRSGRVLVEVTCPFCGRPVLAYAWSMAGTGKKCHCGAVVFPTRAVMRGA